MTGLISIAAGGHAPRWHDSHAALRDHLLARVKDADCSIVVFPEYAAMEAALIGAPEGDPDPLVWRDRGAQAHDLWIDMMLGIAKETDSHILAGSGPAAEGDGVVNRAVLCTPKGTFGAQDKMIPTPHEREFMEIHGGSGLTLFETEIGRIGVLICYDAEFPLFGRALAATGADMLLVPSCTDTSAGHMRVEIAARARALENQCLVVQAPLMGTVPGCDTIYENTGRAGFYGPPDVGQPDDGIHAQGRHDNARWVRDGLDPASILAARSKGDVKLFADWHEQGVADLPVTLTQL